MKNKRDRPTVPVMPVPSDNPTGSLRKQVDRSKVAIVRLESGTWRGLLLEDGVATFYTCELWEADARRWLVKAQAASVQGTWIPTVCPRCSQIRLTPSVCETCFWKKKTP